MKSILTLLAVLLLPTLGFAKDLAVLTIGNSFADSLFIYLPEMAKATPDCNLVLDRANLGGCSLERHWKCVEKDEQKGSKSYKGGKASLKDLLVNRKWDIVTLQQVSTLSFNEASYEPFLGQLIEYVRKHAPDAEILLQETWAYRSDSPYFNSKGTFPADQKTMDEGIEKAVQTYARKYGLRVIPVGEAVQLVRQNQAKPFVPVDKEVLDALKRPALPDQTGSLCGGYYWRANKPAEGQEKTYKLGCDAKHLNRQGQYIQACTWLAFLFEVDAEKITFLPKEITPENAALYRKCAQQAVKEAPAKFPVK